MGDDVKNSIIQNYLKQQINASMGGCDSMSECSHGSSSNQKVKSMEIPDNDDLQNFKAQVRQWIDVDNVIKKLQQAAREKSKVKKELTGKILEFMARYNIEDLNTKDGKIRYKISYTKVPLSQKQIKEKMIEYYDTQTSSDELTKKIFESREKVPKPTLRRVHIQNNGP
jgi:hypothetical protein